MLTHLAFSVLAWLIIPQSINVDIWDGFISLPSWRIFLLVAAVPSFIASFLINFFDESPKFLMSRGRREEALEAFRKIYWINTGKPKDTFPVCIIIIIITTFFFCPQLRHQN